LNIPKAVVLRIHKEDFCSREYFLLHDNAPAHKAASICQFFIPKKCYNPLSPPVLSRLLSARLFSVPQVENEALHFADVAEMQEAVTDELKKSKKEEFSAAFQKLYDRANACIYAKGAYFELK
jgi:hypothetical protein